MSNYYIIVVIPCRTIDRHDIVVVWCGNELDELLFNITAICYPIGWDQFLARNTQKSKRKTSCKLYQSFISISLSTSQFPFWFGVSLCLSVCVCVCYLPQKKDSRHIKSSSDRRYNSCVINHTPFAFCVWCLTACVLRPAMDKRQVFVCVGQKLPKKLYHWHGGRRRGVTQQMANRQKTGRNP